MKLGKLKKSPLGKNVSFLKMILLNVALLTFLKLVSQNTSHKYSNVNFLHVWPLSAPQWVSACNVVS